jgi:hypothetical protein
LVSLKALFIYLKERPHKNPVGCLVPQNFIKKVMVLEKEQVYEIITNRTYRKVTSSDTSHLEAHAGFFRLYMKGIFDLYVL